MNVGGSHQDRRSNHRYRVLSLAFLDNPADLLAASDTHALIPRSRAAKCRLVSRRTVLGGHPKFGVAPGMANRLLARAPNCGGGS